MLVARSCGDALVERKIERSHAMQPECADAGEAGRAPLLNGVVRDFEANVGVAGLPEHTVQMKVVCVQRGAGGRPKLDTRKNTAVAHLRGDRMPPARLSGEDATGDATLESSNSCSQPTARCGDRAEGRDAAERSMKR
jgi:hypothetical protein